MGHSQFVENMRLRRFGHPEF